MKRGQVMEGARNGADDRVGGVKKVKNVASDRGRRERAFARRNGKIGRG